MDIQVQFEGKIPQTIQSDPTRLRQILMNLVGNAVKFTHEGSVKIIARLRGDSAHPQLQIDVVDTGIGLTEAHAANLFRPFSQGDGTMSRNFGGTGLGLIISKRLAELMGGGIFVRSEPGVGSTFSFTVATGSLEGVEMTDQPLVLQDTGGLGEKSAGADAPRIDGMRILPAEDGQDNQRLIGHILRSRGAEVTIVENGRLACEAAMLAGEGGKPFDVILMDMQMPEMDGYAATSKLRQKKYSGVVIALTAHAMESDREKCLAAGCDNYASKPVDRVGLIRMLRDYFNKSRVAA